MGIAGICKMHHLLHGRETLSLISTEIWSGAIVRGHWKDGYQMTRKNVEHTIAVPQYRTWKCARQERWVSIPIHRDSIYTHVLLRPPLKHHKEFTTYTPLDKHPSYIRAHMLADCETFTTSNRFDPPTRHLSAKIRIAECVYRLR